MTHITLQIDPATEARLRMAAEETGRHVEELAEIAVAEAGHAWFAGRPLADPARGMAVLHPLLLAEAL